MVEGQTGVCPFLFGAFNMSRYNEDLEYLIQDTDISKEELEEIIVEADKVISDTSSEKDKLIEAYLKKIQCLQKLDKYNESKEFIDKLLVLNANMPEAFVRLGNVYRENKEHDKAIDCITKAIEIKPDYVAAYNNRGTAKYYLSNYRGAIEDYNKAIEIKPDYAMIYNNRGLAKRYLSDYRGAAKDFKKAEMDILNVLIFFGDNVGEKIVNFMLDDDDFFKETTQKCKEEEINNFKNIYIQSLKIILELQVKEEIKTSVSHYTKTAVLERLLFDNYFKKDEERSPFRLNSVNTSNDLEEGKTLFRYLFPKEDVFSRIQIEEFGAFAGCFILNKDSLNQFRLYGKTEKKEEGTGVSISLNEHFFSEKISIGIKMESGSESKKEENLPPSLPLFRCIYIDPETCKVISLGQKEEYVFYKEGKLEGEYVSYKEKINGLRKKVENMLERLKEMIGESDRDIVCKLLLNLRYLVKHFAFNEEQECRIIQIRKLNDKKVESDENNRLYIEYLEMNEENVSEICFAPKATDIDKFKQHLARNNYNVKCYKSTAPFA
jgi:hypothetical protein